MNVHNWLFWVTQSGMVIGIIGSILLSKEAIITGLILGVGSLLFDSYWREKSDHNNVRTLG